MDQTNEQRHKESTERGVKPSEVPKLLEQLSDLKEKLKRSELGRGLDKAGYRTDVAYYKEQIRLLEKAVVAYEAGDIENAKRLSKRRNALKRSPSEDRLEQWMHNNEVIAKALRQYPRLEEVILYIRHVAPKLRYEECKEICEELDIGLCALYEPDYSHVKMALGMGKRQFQRYLKGFVDCGHFSRITRRKRDRKVYLFVIGYWNIYTKKDPDGKRRQRPPAIISCWNDKRDKETRHKVIAGFGLFRL
jgi:hypothetical protein